MSLRRLSGISSFAGGSALSPAMETSGAVEGGRDLFEACRNGDLERVKKLIKPENVNSRDIAGRKSTPLHFAAGNVKTM